jgi:DNA-binding response OmpR family regulator
MTCAGCIHHAAMADEIAELRAALGLSGRLTERRAIASAFGLAPQEARLLQTLYDAGGKVVPHRTLDSIVLGEKGYENGSDSVKVVVCRVRAKLGPEVVETTFGGGYSLSQAGRALVASALAIGAAA